jgi:hypothetical protein
MRLSKIGYSLIIAGALTLFALPAFAYTRTPSGSIITNPVSFYVSASDISQGMGNTWGVNKFSVKLIYNGNYGAGEGDYKNVSPCYSYTDYPNGLTDIENNLIGDYKEVRIRKWGTSGSPDYSCSGQFVNSNSLESDGGNVIFTITTPAPTNAFPTPTSTAAAILSNISDQFADTGFLAFAILSAGIILGFWAFERFLDIVPHDIKINGTTIHPESEKFDEKHIYG